MDEQRDGLVELDEQELQSVNGGADGDIAWAIGYTLGWCEDKISTAIWYYRTQF